MSANDLASMSRSAQRKLRLLEIEQEQHREDMDALRMTEEQKQTLFRSFTSVKVEFSDLDGLSWTRSALRLPTRDLTRSDSSITSPSQTVNHCTPNNARPSSPSTPAFTVLTNTNFGSLDDGTIRGTSRSHSPRHQQRSPRSRSPVKAIFPTGDNGRDDYSHLAEEAHERRLTDLSPASNSSPPKFNSRKPVETPSPTRRFPQPIVVINDDDDIDDDLKTPIAPRRSEAFLGPALGSPAPVLRREPSGGLKRKR
ncbi:hypothetical protein C8J56DRAFT_1160803 [Mycena floridula]|nr:hypothetical protein C8J56DRAFT_1160803 [Mycena floridula]